MTVSAGDGVRPNKHQIKSERTRLAILDAAEPLFAPHGLVGVSMRQIAAAAGVDLSLVSYHFESKLALYNAVIERIMMDFTQRRVELLDELERRNPNPSAVDLFGMLITAWFEFRYGPAPHRARLIQLRYDVDHHPASEEHWPSDDFVRRFIAALQKAEPDMSTEDIHWAYHCLTGAIIYYMTGAYRIERLSGAYCNTQSQDAVRRALLRHVRGAFPERARAERKSKRRV